MRISLGAGGMGTLGLTALFALFPVRVVGQEPAGDSTADIAWGAELFSRHCQRCHNPRGPTERSAREWVIIMQHMETRATLTRDHSRAVRAFLLASSEAARAPGEARVSLTRVPTPEEIDEALLEAGRQIYRGPGACAACHGVDLGGSSIAPALRYEKWRTGDGSLEAILAVIRNGVSGTAMAPYPAGISDEMAVKVAAYVWAVSQGRTEP